MFVFRKNFSSLFTKIIIKNFKNRLKNTNNIEPRHQSPIALCREASISKEFPPLIFVNYDKLYKAEITNKGHTVQLNLRSSEKDHPKVSGGRLPGDFIFHNIHFHWKAEHTIDGERYPLEAHLVHFNQKYKSFENSLGKEDGLAVLGVMFKIELRCGCRTVFTALTEVIEKVAKKINHPASLQSVIALNQFLPKNTLKYYSYDGSLTTADYLEHVNWTVFTSAMILLKHEYEKLTKIYDGNNKLLECNNRSVQDLNDRPVYFRK